MGLVVGVKCVQYITENVTKWNLIHFYKVEQTELDSRGSDNDNVRVSVIRVILEVHWTALAALFVVHETAALDFG